MFTGFTCVASTIIVFALVALFLYSLAASRKKIQLKIQGNEKRITKYLKIVILLGVLIRLPYLFLITSTDEEFYIYASRMLYEGCKPHVCYFMDHPPLYQYATAQIFKVLGVGIWQAKILPVLFSIASIPLVYYITNRIFGVNEAFFSTAIFALTPATAFQTSTADQYPGLVFFTLAGLACLVKGLDENDKKFTLTSGFFFGVSSMFRLFGPTLWAACLIVLVYRSRRITGQTLALAAGFLASISLLAAAVYSPEFIFQVFIAHIYYSSMPITKKLITFLTGSLPLYLPPIAAAAIALKTNLKNKSPAVQILLLHASITLSMVFLLKYENEMNQLMYFSYVSVPLSILSGTAIHSLDKMRLDRSLVLLAVAAVIVFPNVMYITGAIDWTDTVGEVAGFVKQYPDRHYVGDPAVAFLSGKTMPPKLYFSNPYLIETGQIQEKDFLDMPEGTLLVISEKTYKPEKTLNNKTIQENYRKIYQKSDLQVLEKITGPLKPDKSVGDELRLQDCVKELNLGLYEDEGLQYIKGEIIVQFKQNISEITAKRLIQSYGLTIKKEYEWTPESINHVVLNVPNGEEAGITCKLRGESTSVVRVDPNYVLSIQ